MYHLKQRQRPRHLIGPLLQDACTSCSTLSYLVRKQSAFSVHAIMATLMSLPRQLHDRIFDMVLLPRRGEEIEVENLQLCTPASSACYKEQQHNATSYSWIFAHPRIYYEAIDLVIQRHSIVISRLKPLCDGGILGLRKQCKSLVLDCRGWKADTLNDALSLLSSFVSLRTIEIRPYGATLIQPSSKKRCRSLGNIIR